jgi:peroxisomal enoyl-CoA hydratase 2
VIDFYASQSSIPIPSVPKFDPRRVVDGQRGIRFLKPLPTTSAGKSFEIRSKVLGVYDKGKVGTVVETEQLLVKKKSDGGSEEVEVYARMVGSAVYIGQGNWGGPKGPSTEAFPPPEGRRPDGVFELKLSDEAALLYR